MAKWILNASCSTKDNRPLQLSERHSPVERDVSIERGFIDYIEIFDDLIRRRWGGTVTPERTDVKADEDFFMKYEDDGEETRIIPDKKESGDSTGRLLNQQPSYDRLVNAEVELQSGELMQTGKFIGTSLNHEGAIDGSCNDNLC